MRSVHFLIRRPGHLLATLLGTSALLVGLGQGALAQEGQDAPARGGVTGEELREELQRRDAVIIDLQQRIDLLQRRLEESGMLPSEPEAAADEPTDPAASQPGGGGQGVLDVDELAAERALERTLVDVGALLLPFGQAELSPSVSFTRRNNDFPVIQGGQVFEARTERDEFDFGLGLNVGLPFDSQFELDIPYRLVHEQQTILSGGGAAGADERTGYALDDVSVGFAKTVLRENGGWTPDLILRGTWDTNTGERSEGDVGLGGGFNQLRGQVVAVKRQDPLAFVGAFSYGYTFEDDDVQPGQQFSLSLAATLAVSPETSLNLGLSQSYSDDTQLNGDDVEGSNQLSATLDLGGSVIIAPRTLLRVSSNVGLTDDAPDYSVRAAVAVRFNTPFF